MERRLAWCASLALALVACSPAAREARPAPAVVDEQELAGLLTPHGDERLVLANFWASWCPSCLEELPGLLQIHREWLSRGVRVEAVSIDLAAPQQVKSAEELGTFLHVRGLSLPSAAFAGDWYALRERYRLPDGPPCTLLFDRAGREVGRLEGAREKGEFEALIAAALAR